VCLADTVSCSDILFLGAVYIVFMSNWPVYANVFDHPLPWFLSQRLAWPNMPPVNVSEQ